MPIFRPDFAGHALQARVEFAVSTDVHGEARILFDELFDRDAADRAARLRELGADSAVAREVVSLLAAAARAGDFLQLLPSGELGPNAALIAGRYRIGRLLGSGAMGDVYLARDLQLERNVALKFLRASAAAADPTVVTRFRAEARAAARLDHPHVATLYDSGEADDGRLFIVMAYYQGESLRERIARAQLPVGDALRIAAQIASALAAAHSAGIVHRDVKPANVLFDASGAARLADFGIAKLLVDWDVITRDAAVGTPAYMSPEQLRGDVDASADLWALGVMLHEMLTGHRPRAGSNALSWADALASFDASVRAILATLLTEDRARRPSSAASVRDALDALATAHAAAHAATVRPRLPEMGRGALPNTVTRLFGRARELIAARTFLSASRLLTLLGPGGTGKTRLSLEIATAARDAYPDGVWFVPLAETTEAALVPSSVAQVLGVSDNGTVPSIDRVIAALSTRRALLVLDNMEHVLSSAPLIARLLAECPALSVLVTSRAPLGIQGEQIFPVPPLATPSAGAVNIGAFESVQLFVNRARAVKPSFVLDDESLEAIAEICRRLDGLPLALELAAARATLLSPRAILARLTKSTDLLRAESVDRPARHGTMRAVLDWSYNLLDERERVLFCRLAVFVGGAPLSTVEAVARDLVHDSDVSMPVLELVSMLASKSLVQSEEQSDGEPRIVLLETIREYGLERLAEGTDDAIARRAHRTAFVAFAQGAAQHLRGPSQRMWLDRLEREYANLRAAWESALADRNGGLADAASLAVSLYRLWLTRGPLLEGSVVVTRILDAIEHPDAPPLSGLLHARVVASAAHLAGSRSVFPEARELFARALALYRDAGDRAGIASTLANLGWQTWAAGDLAHGETLSREALTLHEELGDPLGVALSRNNLAWIAMERGEFDQAQSHFEAVIASHEQRGDARSVAYANTWLGTLMARRGELARSVELHMRAMQASQLVIDDGYRLLLLVRIAATRHALGEPEDHAALVEHSYLPPQRQFGRLWPLGATLTELGRMLIDNGDAARAHEVLTEALAARRASGGLGSIVESELLDATALLHLNDVPRCAALLRDALSAAMSYGSRPLLIDGLERTAHMLLAVGDGASAAVLSAAAARAFAVSGARRSPRDERALANFGDALLASLESASLDDAVATGAALSLNDAAHRAVLLTTALAHV